MLNLVVLYLFSEAALLGPPANLQNGLSGYLYELGHCSYTHACRKYVEDLICVELAQLNEYLKSQHEWERVVIDRYDFHCIKQYFVRFVLLVKLVLHRYSK